MSAGDGDAVFQAHEFGKHFSSGNNRNGQLLSCQNFRVAVLDSGRRDHDVCTPDICFGMAPVYAAA